MAHHPAARKPGHAVRQDHPAAPLVEVEILRLPAFRIIGFPNAAPLRRPLVSSLENDAGWQILQVLRASAVWRGKLLDYASTYDNLADPGPDDEKLAGALAKLIRSGRIGARGPAGGISGRPTMIIAESETLRLSMNGERFLYQRETVPGHPELSAHLYWPRGESGVTIGPGYDMKDRPKDQIVADLEQIGVNPQLAVLAADGARLDKDNARDFAERWKNLLNLSNNQQLRLLEHVASDYVGRANNGITQSVRKRLFIHEFDALVSFTYNVGNLRSTSVAHRLNNGDVTGSITSMAHYRTADPNRRFLEMALYREARY